MEADRQWAQQRIRNFFRKEKDSKSLGKDQPEVSQPGDPAEKEADAVGDHVADQLHGANKGADARDQTDGAEDAGKAPAPPIGAKLQGVGRKVFLARQKNDQSPQYTKKQCQTAIKILTQYERLAKKLQKNLPQSRIDELNALRDAGTITLNLLPGSLRSEFDLPADMPLSEIRRLEKEAK